MSHRENRALDVITDRAKSWVAASVFQMRRFSAVHPRFKILQSVCVKDRKPKRKFKHKSRAYATYI